MTILVKTDMHAVPRSSINHFLKTVKAPIYIKQFTINPPSLPTATLRCFCFAPGEKMKPGLFRGGAPTFHLWLHDPEQHHLHPAPLSPAVLPSAVLAHFLLKAWPGEATQPKGSPQKCPLVACLLSPLTTWKYLGVSSNCKPYTEPAENQQWLDRTRCSKLDPLLMKTIMALNKLMALQQLALRISNQLQWPATNWQQQQVCHNASLKLNAEG